MSKETGAEAVDGSRARPRLDDPDLLDEILSEAIGGTTAPPREPPEPAPAARTISIPAEAAKPRVAEVAVAESGVVEPVLAQAEVAPPVSAPAGPAHQASLPDSLRPVTSTLPPPPSKAFAGPDMGSEPEPIAEQPVAEQESRPPWRSIIEWGAVIVLALLVALVIRGFFLQAFFIPSASMADTLEIDDRVLVNKLSYEFGEPSRGDIIVFARPAGGPEDGINDLIKRVVGLAGERVEISDSTLYVDGDPIEESYVDAAEVYPDFGPETVPEGHVFVMGDNRDDSRDSRVFGPVPDGDIVGRAFFKIWPITSLGFL